MLTSCESKVACKISGFYSISRFLKFDWRFQELGVSDPTPTGLALQFEFLKSKKGKFSTKVIFFARKSSRRSLLGKIFDKLRIQGRMQIFEKKSQSALNHVLILQKDRTQKMRQIPLKIVDLQNDFNICVAKQWTIII